MYKSATINAPKIFLKLFIFLSVQSRQAYQKTGKNNPVMIKKIFIDRFSSIAKLYYKAPGQTSE